MSFYLCTEWCSVRLIGNMGGQLFRCKCLLKDVLQRCVLSMPWRRLPSCGIVEFKRSSYDTDLGFINESVAPVFFFFFHVKLKNFRSAVWKTVATAVTRSPPATQDGPCTLNRLFHFVLKVPTVNLLVYRFFCLFLRRRKMFTLPSFKKILKDKKKWRMI